MTQYLCYIDKILSNACRQAWVTMETEHLNELFKSQCHCWNPNREYAAVDENKSCNVYRAAWNQKHFVRIVLTTCNHAVLSVPYSGLISGGGKYFVVFVVESQSTNITSDHWPLKINIAQPRIFWPLLTCYSVYGADSSVFCSHACSEWWQRDTQLLTGEELHGWLLSSVSQIHSPQWGNAWWVAWIIMTCYCCLEFDS